MALTQTNISTLPVEILFNDTLPGNAVISIKASSAKVFFVTLDNSLNGAASYVKLFNLASGSVTLGTSAPDEVLYIPASSIVTTFYLTSSAPGKTFGTALSYAVVTTGGTAGTTSPSSATVLTVSYI
jgi:hypothetical protein